MTIMSQTISEENQTIVPFKFSPKQTIARRALDRVDISELLFGGAKGGGKSVFGCQWLYIKCKELILRYNLQPQEYPLPVAFMGRKRGADFSKTTLETWKRFIPFNLYRIREHDKEIIIDETVKILYGGLDDETNISKFNSMELAYVFIDQAEEIDRTDLALLKGTQRLKINEERLDYKVLLTANPAPCFLKDDYILSPREYQLFIQALPKDNPWLGSEYAEMLREAFKHRPELVRAYVEGSWDDLEGYDTLIAHSWIMRAVNADTHIHNDRRVTVCDVARFGNDETVIYNLIDNTLGEAMIYGHKDTTISAANIVIQSAKNKSDLIAIDADGMGGPVCDMVAQLLKDKQSKTGLLEIHSGHTAEKEDHYVNSRAEMWFYASNLFAEGEVCIPDDKVLMGQLSAVKYSPNGSRGRFQIEKKEETKRRLERSPDRADALIYGLWALSKVAKKQYDFKRVDMDLSEEQTRSKYGWEG